MQNVSLNINEIKKNGLQSKTVIMNVYRTMQTSCEKQQRLHMHLRNGRITLPHCNECTKQERCLPLEQTVYHASLREHVSGHKQTTARARIIAERK